jgi:hypothetical protein
MTKLIGVALLCAALSSCSAPLAAHWNASDADSIRDLLDHTEREHHGDL